MAAANDLALICCKGEQVHVASSKLIDASCNSAFKEIITKAVNEYNGSKLAQLAVPEDSYLAWKICMALLEDPSSKLLNWAKVAPVLKLCDKYELTQVLHIVHKRIIYSAFQTINDKTFASLENNKLHGTHVSRYNPLGMLHSDEVCYDSSSTALGIYVDTATMLHSVEDKTAYHAFISAWIHSFHKAEKPSTIQQSVCSLTKGLSQCLQQGPSCPAKFQLALDLLSLLPGLGFKE